MRTDSEIQKDVMDALKWEPFLNAAEIGVAVRKGIVTLSGEVDSYAKKSAAERAAKKIDGVKAVAEEIEVKLSNDGWRNDTEIAEAILNAFKWHSVVKENTLKIKVENGWVTLEGMVDWEFEKNTATSLVEDQMGVRGITNLIKVAPRVNKDDVKRNINAAFHKSAATDASQIKIEITGNKVTLKGIVHSLEERKGAEDAALATPGITEIDNELLVENEASVDTSEGTTSFS